MQDDLLKSCMRESRTYSSVRGVEINVYSTNEKGPLKNPQAALDLKERNLLASTMKILKEYWGYNIDDEFTFEPLQ